MRRAKFPSGVPVFELTESTNSHWNEGDLVEVLEDRTINLGGKKIAESVVWHHCAAPHIGYAWSLDSFKPLNADARAMLAIARSRR